VLCEHSRTLIEGVFLRFLRRVHRTSGLLPAGGFRRREACGTVRGRAGYVRHGEG
jgi:hypothetical protein